MRQLRRHDQSDHRGPVHAGRVEARIDGRLVEAVIVGEPWAEAGRAFRRFAEVLAEVAPLLEDPRE